MKIRDLALVLGILGLVATWFGCLRATHNVATSRQTGVPPPTATKPEPVTQSDAVAPAPVAKFAAATLGLSYAENGKILLEGAVNSEAEKARVVQVAQQRYGAQRVVDQINVDTKLGAIGSITLTGAVASAADKRRASADAQEVFGAKTSVDNQLAVVSAAVAAVRANVATAAVEQQRGLRAGLIGKSVEFESNSATLTARGKTVLDGLVPIIQAEIGTRIEVQGHTDASGGVTANKALSQRRAAEARAYLVGKGVAAARLSAHGLGQEKPLADNATPEGRRQNRRIEFLVQERN